LNSTHCRLSAHQIWSL